MRKDIADAMRVTDGNTGMKLVVALNYGGRAELADAFNALLEPTKRARTARVIAFARTKTDISEHLYTAGLPDPDLLIRTSGEMRVSNFLLWQIAYAEIYVTEALWPDFSRARLLEALVDFQKRERRYGGLGAPRARADAAAAPMRAPASESRAGARAARCGLTPMRARILTAIVLIPVVVALVWWGPPRCCGGGRGVVAIVALVEFFDLAERMGLRAFRKWTMVCTAGAFLRAVFDGLVETRTSQRRRVAGAGHCRGDGSDRGGAADVSVSAPWHRAGDAAAAARSFAGAWRSARRDCCSSRCRSAIWCASAKSNTAGRELLLFTLCLIWAGDMLAYFVGRSLGRLKMAPALSPKKTWEGRSRM